MAGDKARLFAGLEVPPDRLEALDEALADLQLSGSDLRFVKLENQHVTLKFFGWLGPEEADAAGRMMKEVAASHRQGPLALSDLGAFPSFRRVRILWAGVEDPSGTTTGVAEALDAGAAGFGVAREERSFRPHLTLARSKRPRPLEHLPQVPPEARRTFDFGELVLFKSHLSSAGARYEVIHRFVLG